MTDKSITFDHRQRSTEVATIVSPHKKYIVSILNSILYFGLIQNVRFLKKIKTCFKSNNLCINLCAKLAGSPRKHK